MAIKYLKLGISLIMLCWLSSAMALNPEERKIIKAIKAGDIEFVNSIIKDRSNIDCEFSNGKSGLYYAIKYDRIQIAKLILDKGAKPNFISGKYPLLTWAIKYNRRRIARLLIEFGADVNRPDNKLNTPLIIAAKLNNLWMCKMLIDRGANPTHKNLKSKRAIDFTMYWDNENAQDYLSSMEKKWIDSDTIPSYHDGPYIFKESENELVMQYYEHIQSDHLTRLIEKTIFYSGKDTIVSGIGWDKNTYHIRQKYQSVPDKIITKAKIFVVGDVHGEYNALLKLLINNRIVDLDRNWIFGNGQLVFLGDLFDRGSMVTETLWYLHELGFDAAESGGNVFVLLGNHEIMAMTGDHRYINDKYIYFDQYTYTNYFQLYEKESVLGAWLRNQNMILQINDNLLMHAGISPQFSLIKISYQAINLALQMYLNSDYETKKGSIEDIILSSYGPLWYRGYAYTENRLSQVPQQFVDNYLNAKGLSRMILGHNEQTGISISHKGKVVSVDVYINDSGESAQGLLVSKDKLYRCYSDGRKEIIEK